MRVIRAEDVRERIPQAWLDRARARTADLHREFANTKDHREKNPQQWRAAWSETVNAAANLWQDGDLKRAFSRVSSGKCWYCEAHVDQEGDVAIDHYRPKNRVKEDPGHDGYWWLACDWKNYRYACTWCNSHRRTDATHGGKQDRFPLWEESSRGRSHESGIDDEIPLLLDPMKATDVALLTFDRSGLPAPTVGKESTLEHHRVEVSIRILHLDRPSHARRRREIMAEIERHLEAADRQSRELARAQRLPAGGADGAMARRAESAAAISAYEHAVSTLLGYLRPTAEYSRAARVFLASMRGSSKTAELIFDQLTGS